MKVLNTKGNRLLIMRYGMDIYKCLELILKHIPKCCFYEMESITGHTWIEARNTKANTIACFEYIGGRGEMSLLHLASGGWENNTLASLPALEYYLLCLSMTEIIEK